LRRVKKNGQQSIGRSKGGLTTKIHMVSAGASKAVDFILGPGNAHDAPAGRILLETIGKRHEAIPLLMDRAYEDDETRYTAQMLNFNPVVPPKSNRKNPWDYDKELYKRRNEVERLFRLIQGFRRIFTRYDKLDIMYGGFIRLALVFVALR
jgi:transposase